MTQAKAEKAVAMIYLDSATIGANKLCHARKLSFATHFLSVVVALLYLIVVFLRVFNVIYRTATAIVHFLTTTSASTVEIKPKFQYVCLLFDFSFV